MDATAKISFQSAETRANRLEHQREREKSLRASETAEEREESLRKHQMSQVGYLDYRAERGNVTEEVHHSKQKVFYRD